MCNLEFILTSTFALKKLYSCTLEAISVDSICGTVMDSTLIRPTSYIELRSLIQSPKENSAV